MAGTGGTRVGWAFVIVVPSQFAADTSAREGEAGRSWVQALPGLVERYLDRWVLAPDGAPMHGYVALVLPVRGADGTPAVLKSTRVPRPRRLPGRGRRRPARPMAGLDLSTRAMFGASGLCSRRLAKHVSDALS